MEGHKERLGYISFETNRKKLVLKSRAVKKKKKGSVLLLVLRWQQRSYQVQEEIKLRGDLIWDRGTTRSKSSWLRLRNDAIAFDQTDDTPLNRAEWCESISATSTIKSTIKTENEVMNFFPLFCNLSE